MIARVSWAARDNRRGSSLLGHQEGEVGGSLEPPSISDARQLHPAPGIPKLQARNGGLDCGALRKSPRKIIEAERPRRRKQEGLDPPLGFLRGGQASTLRRLRR